LIEKVKAAPESQSVAALLGEDWDTQGDWVGHYGRQDSFWPGYSSTPREGFDLHSTVGPHVAFPGEGGNYFYTDHWGKSEKVLYIPEMGRRMQGEWNDGGWRDRQYGPNFEGPDLWFDASVPSGVHRVSFYNYLVGLSAPDRRRDYVLSLLNYIEDLKDAQHEPVLARVRVEASQDPAYRTFLVSGGHYWFHFAGNYSHMVGVQALFVDAADFTAPAQGDAAEGYLYGVKCDPPQPGPESLSESSPLRAARALWAALDANYAATVNMQLPYRMLAYRAAAAAGAEPDLLENWRWNLHLWTPQDRIKWDNTMAESRKLIPAPTGAGGIPGARDNPG
jgi:hypothetical protein